MVGLLPTPYHHTETYRISDPISNLKLRVTLRRRGTLGQRRKPGEVERKAQPAQSRTKNPGKGNTSDSQDDSDDELDGDNASDASAGSAGGGKRDARSKSARKRLALKAAASETKPLKREEAEETREIAQATFLWQEKVYGRHEVEQIRRLKAGEAENDRGFLRSLIAKPSSSFVQAQQIDAIAGLDLAARERGESEYAGELLHTRVHTEDVSDATEWAQRFTSSGSISKVGMSALGSQARHGRPRELGMASRGQGSLRSPLARA